jgi:hypothetical protein
VIPGHPPAEGICLNHLFLATVYRLVQFSILFYIESASLFNTPIDDIKIDDVVQFLQSGIREGTILEFKEQFPNKLEKYISSMANTFGGMILIGVEETSAGAGVLPIKGVPLTDGFAREGDPNWPGCNLSAIDTASPRSGIQERPVFSCA